MNRVSAGHALLRRELMARRGALARIAFWSVLEALPALLSGLVLAAAVNRFGSGDILAGLTVLALLPAAAAVAASATHRLLAQVSDVVEPVREAFVAAVVAGALTAATGTASPPDAAGVARLTQQVQTVRGLLAALLRTVRQVGFALAAAIAGLGLLAPLVALITGGMVLVSLAGLALTLPGLAARHRAVLDAEEAVADGAATAVRGIRDVVALGAQDRLVREVGRAIDDEAAHTRALARASALRSIVVFTGGQLPLVLLLAGAPWLLRAGMLTPAQLAGAAAYLTLTLEPALRALVGAVGGWGLDLVLTVRRLGEGFALVTPQADPRPDPGAGSDVGCDGYRSGADVEVRDLAFAYGPGADPIVRGLRLAVPDGGHLAVVGPSGTGKSTLALLLAGLLTPQAGQVLIGGVDVRRIPPARLRQLVGLIPQEAYVFAGTLRENLTYLAPAASEADIATAVAAVGLVGVADRLGGLDASVGTAGSQLSTGERQLVALTRTYLSPARLVVLDEAAYGLDPAAEARVEAAFADRPGTLIVIAHRISSARRAGRVLLLDGGGTRLGTHDELTRDSPRYADLVNHWTPPAGGWEGAAGCAPRRRGSRTGGAGAVGG